MATNEGNTQPSNSNRSYFPSQSIAISPSYSQPYNEHDRSQVYVYDVNYPFDQYYACYYRSPVDYPPTPSPYILEQPHENGTPQSPSYPPYNSTSPPYEPIAPSYTLQLSSPHNQMSFKYNMTTGYPVDCPVHGFPGNGHTEGESSTRNNDNEEVMVNKSYSVPREASCPPHSAVFDCNICMEMAKEPVVTSCGHLYCWPCIYNWLHYHSTDFECPVCNGEVHVSMIIPIYGQGTYDDGKSYVRVPPRPCGRRFESSNQW